MTKKTDTPPANDQSDAMRRVYQHELKHILRGHFGRDINLSDAELDASE